MGEAQRKRLAPEARKVLLLDAAEATFVARGYTQSGLAEIADAAGVSKTLLYHYYPDGRPELYREVVERLAAEVVDRLREAGGAPVAPARRLSRVVDALLAFFEEHPTAYRLIILEPWGSGDPSVIGQATAVRMRLASEVAGVLAASGLPSNDIAASSAAVVGALLHLVELQASGAIDAERARSVADAFIQGGLAGIAGLDPS